MLFDVPSSLGWLLFLFRPCFTQPTFETFCGLCLGLLTRVRDRTVTGMLVASGLSGSWHHSRAHRFFSRARWSPDGLGLVGLELIVTRLLARGEPVCVAIDDTLFERYGRRVFARHLHFDGSSQMDGPKRITFGNNWVVAGVVVKLPFLARAVCLPVLFRLWRQGGPKRAELALELVGMIAQRYPGRRVIVLADGGYAGGALAPSALPENVCLVVRTQRNTRLHAPPPPRGPHTKGRPRVKGEPLPSPAELAAQGTHWETASILTDRHARSVELFSQSGLWYRGWGCVPAKVVCVRDPSAAGQIAAVIITSDPELPDPEIIELYHRRWAIEVAFRDAKQLSGVGEAQNRTRLAVERTAPFAFLSLSIAIVWYALAGHAPSDITEHRRTHPWYRTKHQPSVQDMLTKLRRTIIASRFLAATSQTPARPKLQALAQAWELAAA
jgi:hypothetical protein